jgi:hypothetical protein
MRKVNLTISDEAMTMISKLEKELQKLKDHLGLNKLKKITLAKITTDNWKGYRPISKDYNITQIPSKSGANFKTLHTMIHQIKTWIRTTYSWVSKRNIERYFNEFLYRINRSQNKNRIFNNLNKKNG